MFFTFTVILGQLTNLQRTLTTYLQTCLKTKFCNFVMDVVFV